jgi:hypothetical protein
VRNYFPQLLQFEFDCHITGALKIDYAYPRLLEINFELISKQLLFGVGESSVSKCGIIPHLLPFEFIAIPPKFVSKSRKRAMLFFRIGGNF